MRSILLIFITIFISATALGQSLKFRSDGTFTIAQFTDIHFKNGNSASDTALLMINRVLEGEKPDIAILTGDIVVEPAPVIDGWVQVLAPFQKAGIPVAVTLGNHDDEHGTSREELYRMLALQTLNVEGVQDFSLTIFDDQKPAALLYMFDSKAYSTIDSVKGYGWITPQQIQQYISKSKKYTAQNEGKPLPALAFFHIPLPEHAQAAQVNKVIGTRGENECHPAINTGMFAAMKICGDVIGCFVGHDHVNDYLASLHGIALAYGRFSGHRTTYGDLENGARIIKLTLNKQGFDTYIRLREGDIINKTSFPIN